MSTEHKLRTSGRGAVTHLRPPVIESDPLHRREPSPRSQVVTASASSGSQRRRTRPGWNSTLVREASFDALRAIQKSTTDPRIDLSYLSEACVRMALDSGRDEIVKRALAEMDPLRSGLRTT